jgi:hypothetical protein
MEKPDIVLMGPFRLQMYLAEDMDPYIAELRERERVLVEALTWYERWVGECNKDGMEGDTARGRLARDIGKTASAALEAAKE